jgi:hypothetical protein
MACLIQVNGLIVDAQHAPREIQEEAFRLSARAGFLSALSVSAEAGAAFGLL